MLNLTFLTGAGISLESGFPLYTRPAYAGESRQGYTKQDLSEKRGKLLEYYNALSQKVSKALPSDAHYLISALEAHYHVNVITQNIDNLHERAGSTRVLHLHGQIDNQLTELGCCHSRLTHECIDNQSKCEHGSHWRHDIVLYGEPIKQYTIARRILALTDVLVVIGCSMRTNTVNTLIEQVHAACPIYFINPCPALIPNRSILIRMPAYQGLWLFLNHLTNENNT